MPLFTELNLVPTGKLEPKPFEAAYAESRMLSLLHYWLLNMEQLDGNVTPFEELLAPDFVLDFSTAGLIESTEQLATWLQTVPTQLKLSSHYPQNFMVKAVGDNQYKMEVDAFPPLE